MTVSAKSGTTECHSATCGVGECHLASSDAGDDHSVTGGSKKQLSDNPSTSLLSHKSAMGQILFPLGCACQSQRTTTCDCKH